MVSTACNIISHAPLPFERINKVPHGRCGCIRITGWRWRAKGILWVRRRCWSSQRKLMQEIRQVPVTYTHWRKITTYSSVVCAGSKNTLSDWICCRMTTSKWWRTNFTACWMTREHVASSGDAPPTGNNLISICRTSILKTYSFIEKGSFQLMMYPPVCDQLYGFLQHPKYAACVQEEGYNLWNDIPHWISQSGDTNWWFILRNKER